MRFRFDYGDCADQALEIEWEACPGCGCMPGDGRSHGCNHPGGCGYWDSFEDGVGR